MSTPELGFAWVSAAPGATSPNLADAVQAVLATSARVQLTGSAQAVVWGGPADGAGLTTGEVLLLTAHARRRNEEVSAEEVRRMLVGGDRTGLARMLPTFGAATLAAPGVLVACTDALGFRQLYVRSRPGWCAVSTSARVLAALGSCGVDTEALGIQSLLGWQLGHRTIFSDVSQVPAGGLVRAHHGSLIMEKFVHRRQPEPQSLATAVPAMRDMLRDYLDAFLYDHPDPVLQLTGGQDSRLLLSAIPRSRRAGLRVVTLEVPGSQDVAVAAELARRDGMRHEVLDLEGIEEWSPAEAYARCLSAAGSLELMTDPIARAVLDGAEARALPGPRLSGLGGEIARGFYYLGRNAEAPVTLRRVRQLVNWRMFVNEATGRDVFEPDFTAWAREFATGEVHRILDASGEGWFRATDRLYLEQRMQRWAGVTETAQSTRRMVANPMLDDRFVATAAALAPRDKRNSRFLSQLQLALDSELGAIPLDGRPAPRRYAEPGLVGAAARTASTVDLARNKVSQRLRGRGRPPAGGEIVAARVAEHWREDSSLLDAVARLGVFREEWLEDLRSGARIPEPSAVSLVVNVGLAVQACRPAKARASLPLSPQ